MRTNWSMSENSSSAFAAGTFISSNSSVKRRRRDASLDDSGAVDSELAHSRTLRVSDTVSGEVLSVMIHVSSAIYTERTIQ